MRRLLLSLLSAMLMAAFATPAGAVRLKDIGHVDGVRPNQLIGYGLVVGLAGTGDSQRTPFTAQSIKAMLSRLGVRVEASKLGLRNVAAVMVTTELPAFSQPGAALDVTVSSIGDARSLTGGTLLMTPLTGANGDTFAVAQGTLTVDQVSRRSRLGEAARQTNVGRITMGATVEKTVPVQLSDDGVMRFLVAKPDFTTATRVAAVINDLSITRYKTKAIAKALDSGVVAIQLPKQFEDEPAPFIAAIEGLDVEADHLATVVVNGRTGTVVLGAQVRLSEAAIAHRGVTIEIGGGGYASRGPYGPYGGPSTTTFAGPVGPGAPASVAGGAAGGGAPATPAGPAEPEPTVRLLTQAATLAEVVAGLNALGVPPNELTEILQALEAAGALHARVEVR
ncbi:MAG: flagellar P-ring protein precursor FlgI [Myxococcota bacterium]|jgi:flagellar P-ring protein precursor FlgI